MTRTFTLTATLLLVWGAAHAAAPGERPQLAVLDFEARGVDAALAAGATEAAAGALRELRVFKVASQAEVRQMLAVERDKALLVGSCEDSSCLGKIGNAVGARYVVSGTVAQLDRAKGTYDLRVRMFDMKSAEVIGDERRSDLATPKAVLEAAPGAALVATRPILDKEQGFLELVTRELGANVTVDGRLVGVTPFPTQRLGWGPHRVVVEKEGFIAWAKDVQIERNQATAETVVLIPSPEFIDAYRSRHRALRGGAWATTVIAVLAAGASLGVQYGIAERKYEQFKPLQEAFAAKSGVEDACRAEAGTTDPQACYSFAQKLSSDGNAAQWASRGVAAVAVVSAGLSLYFWLAGDDPGKYDAYRNLGAPGAPAAGLYPIPGGAAGALTFSF